MEIKGPHSAFRVREASIVGAVFEDLNMAGSQVADLLAAYKNRKS